MLTRDDTNVGLLEEGSPKKAAPKVSQISDKDEDEAPKPKQGKKKEKGKGKQRSEVTYVLKVLNLLVGAAFLAFSIFCYGYGFDGEDIDKNALVLKYVMPAYIGISGLIILAIECRIGAIVRNMRFFYNYFGRGLFNIYAGVMPLMMISDFEGSFSTFKIITLVASSIMTLIGILYCCLKLFCC